MTTVSQWLHAAADLPRLDCEVVLNHVLGLSRAQILTHPQRPLSVAEQQALGQAAARMRRGQPTAYIVGRQEFWGMPFKVSPAVLIPRPETELLVEHALETLGTLPADARVLDLGTGSGAIAVALARERPDLQMTAVDVSAAALDVARGNAAANRVEIEFQQCNWFDGLAGRWHLIVSNPPYIRAQDPHLPALVNEPAEALVGGADGLCALRHIVDHAPNFLYPHGQLLVEHGYDQGEPVAALFDARAFADIRTLPDLAGIPRVTAGRITGEPSDAG